MTVIIEGRNLIPCAKLLEALTNATLLDPKCLWDEELDKIKLTVPDDDQTRKSFESKGFRIVE